MASIKITVDRIQPGLHIRLPVKWNEHPFLFNSFKVKNQEQIQLIRHLGIQHVYINPSQSDTKPLPPNQKIETFAQALRSVCQPIMGKDLSDFSFAKLLGQMLHLAESFDMTIQPHLLLLQKNMVMAEGVSRGLQENLNLWAISQPLVEEWIIENRGPEAIIKDGVTSLTDSLKTLPKLIHNLEAASGVFSQQGLRLHDKTIQDFHNESSGTAKWAFIIAIASFTFSIGFAVNFIFFNS
ncbi:DUF3391 domain-containing protein [uncultured Kiloniella sp.]|uniref:DUF3391 domain-containing protein n=1 Tax=uncultured Kiloniella sp. TaxID=1133091 RepID=UPI0026333D20|nr:DUF3391 domain-containing protein [uncultured Kiloniella sp.]